LFQSLGFPERGLPQKAVVLLDNAPSHPRESVLTSDDGHYKVFAHNVTAIIQPMVQGVIASMECYQAGLLRSLANENDTIIPSWKKMAVLDAIYAVISGMVFRESSNAGLIMLFTDLDDDLQGFPYKEVN
jgi:hypothetical protein